MVMNVWLIYYTNNAKQLEVSTCYFTHSNINKDSLEKWVLNPCSFC